MTLRETVTQAIKELDRMAASTSMTRPAFREAAADLGFRLQVALHNEQVTGSRSG